MNMIKHLGKKKDSGVKLAVIYMTIPDDPDHCLVADIDSLTDTLRDDLMEVIRSQEGQNTRNLYDLLYRRINRGSGTSILESLHNSRNLMKLRTDEVVMTPTNTETILLSDLNNLIRKINDGTENKDDSEIELERNVRKQQIETIQEDERSNIGKNLLAQADDLESQAKMLVEEAKRKRLQAEEYFPKKKKAVKKVNELTANDVAVKE